MNARGTPDDPARVLAGMFAELDRHRRALAQRASLGTADMRLLWLFTDGRTRTLRQIAEQLNLEQSTVNRQVNAAIKAGLLTREREHAASAYRFDASAKGAREFERNLHASLDAYRTALDALGGRQQEFLALLRDYLDASHSAIHGVEATTPRPHPPHPTASAQQRTHPRRGATHEQADPHRE